MSIQNYFRARSILYLGAQSLSESSGKASGNKNDFAKLFHTWAVCEWHLSNVVRSELLFDHALRLTESGDEGSEIRSSILFSLCAFYSMVEEKITLLNTVSVCLLQKVYNQRQTLAFGSCGQKLPPLRIIYLCHTTVHFKQKHYEKRSRL